MNEPNPVFDYVTVRVTPAAKTALIYFFHLHGGTADYSEKEKLEQGGRWFMEGGLQIIEKVSEAVQKFAHYRDAEGFDNNVYSDAMIAAIPQEIVAMDGKALRRALDRDQNVKYIVSAWAESNSLVLGQLKVADKSNEITALPELLRVLELSGCIVTTDAMGCQKKIAREIVEADADYVLALKGNQERVHEEVKTFLDQILVEKQGRGLPAGKPSRAAAALAAWETVEKDHGRLETRRYYQSDQLAWFADLKKWEGLKSVGMVEATREIAGRKTTERRYYLSSLPLGVETFARAVRGHWGVENKLHWVMDVHFREDQSRARAGYAAENLATLRRLAFNLLKSEKTKKRGIRGKQLNASRDHPYLLRLLGI